METTLLHRPRSSRRRSLVTSIIAGCLALAGLVVFAAQSHVGSAVQTNSRPAVVPFGIASRTLPVFSPIRNGLVSRPTVGKRQTAGRVSIAPLDMKTASVEEMIKKSKDDRITHLEEQAMEALKYAVENSHHEHPVFPCAMIAGDMVILDLLNRLGYVSTGK
eukprot:1392172-Amorphochlora_amoeboformis.AAC.2